MQTKQCYLCFCRFVMPLTSERRVSCATNETDSGRSRETAQSTGSRNSRAAAVTPAEADETAEEVLRGRTRVMFLDVVAGGFEQFAILDAARADGLAGAAAEAQIDVADGGVAEGETSILHGAHEMDATARRIVFVASFEIGRAGGKAEATVDAREGFLVVEEGRGRRGNGIHKGRSGRMCFGSKVSLMR